MTIRNLDYLFKPRSMALIGSGRDIDAFMIRNLMGAGFKGPIMPVDATRQALEGVLTYPDIASLPVTPDLAVITAPLRQAPALIGQLGERGARAAVIISEDGQTPARAERESLCQAILETARPWLLRVLGPTSLGLAVSNHGVNACLSQTRMLPGRVACLAHSSAMARAGLDWSAHLGVGLSHIIGLGAGIDVDISDILDYLANDHHSLAILLYLEEIQNPRKFMSAARRAARIKPLIVLKPRRYIQGDAPDAVYEAAFRRAGILRVSDRHELFTLVETLTAAQPVSSDRLAILSNSRSLALLAVDTLDHYGGRLAPLAEDTLTALAGLVGAVGSPGNPVDLGDQAGAETYGKALDLLLQDRHVDGVLVINAPGALSDPLPVADTIIERLPKARRCLLASFVGPITGQAARRKTMKYQIPTYETSDEAVRAFMRLVQHKRNQELLRETPSSLAEEFTPDLGTARQIIAAALASGRHHLNEYESLRLLAAYGIPVLDSQVATDPAAAETIAARLGGAVALKILSPDIPSKSQVGGVLLYLNSPEAVREAAEAMLNRVRQVVPEAHIDGFMVQPMEPNNGAYEITLGVQSGGRFGPLIYFGQGGTEAEAIRDIAYGLPPLNMNLAQELMSQTRIYPMLRDSQLRSADLNALAQTLIKVSQMVIDLGEIVALDVNPLWADAHGVLAVDARVRIAAFEGKPANRLAIRPYPKELEEVFPLPDGRTLYLRPIRPEDEPALRALVQRTPLEDLRMRFFQPIRDLSHDMAARLTQIDYNREMALIIAEPGLAGKVDIYGVVRITIYPDNEQAEYAILVDRNMTGLGLGPMLMRRIINYTRAQGVKQIFGEVLRENEPMLRLNRALGFDIQVHPEDREMMHVTLDL